MHTIAIIMSASIYMYFGLCVGLVADEERTQSFIEMCGWALFWPVMIIREAMKPLTYALFKDGKQVSKAHGSRYAVVMEAYEQGAVVTCATDFIGDIPGGSLAEGYEILPVCDDLDAQALGAQWKAMNG